MASVQDQEMRKPGDMEGEAAPYPSWGYGRTANGEEKIWRVGHRWNPSPGRCSSQVQQKARARRGNWRARLSVGHRKYSTEIETTALLPISAA